MPILGFRSKTYKTLERFLIRQNKRLVLLKGVLFDPLSVFFFNLFSERRQSILFQIFNPRL